MGNCCSKPDDEEETHVDPRTPLLSNTIKTIADTNDLSTSSKRISRKLGFSFRSSSSARNLAYEAANRSSKKLVTPTSSLSEFPRPPSNPPIPDFDVNNPPNINNNNNNNTEKPKLRQSEELKKRLSTISNNDNKTPTPPSTSQKLIKYYNDKEKEEKERLAKIEMDQKLKEEKEKERMKAVEAAIEKEKARKKTAEREKYNFNLSKILTSKNSDITPQERVSQAVQTLLEVCKEIGEIISSSTAITDMTAETTMKKRLDVLTLQASKNTVQLCEVVDTLTQTDFTSKSHLNTLKRSESKRGKWEYGLRENTRKASTKIEQLMIECRNANVDQRKANVRMFQEKIEELLEKIRTEATLLVELVLAQWEVSQSAESIVEATNRHQSIMGIETVLRAAKVAVSVVHRLIDSLSDAEVSATEGPTELVRTISSLFGPGQDSKDMDQAVFFSNALHVCALQLFDAVDTIAQTHFDPGVQLELWNKAKAVRGSGILLQIAITEKDRVLSDRCLSLSAASRVYASSVVNLIDSSASAVTMEPPKIKNEEQAAANLDWVNVWKDEENMSSIILMESPSESSSTPPVSPMLRPPINQNIEINNAKNNTEKDSNPYIDPETKEITPTTEIKNESNEVEETIITTPTPPTTPRTTTATSPTSHRNSTPSSPRTSNTKLSSSSSESISTDTKMNSSTSIPSNSSGSGSRIEIPTKKLKAATLNGLLLNLIFDRIDIQYMETLALTYRSFSDPFSFFLKLAELYNVPETKGEQKIVIQSRVANFIKKWITSHFQDFSYDLVSDIIKWTEDVLQKSNHTKALARQILDLLSIRNSEQSAMRLSIQAAVTTRAHKDFIPNRFALDMEANEIALQLTWIDQQAFSAIRPHELLFQSWNKPHLRHRAPNVLSMISRTNNVALWVASSILWHPKLMDRAHVMTNLILVAEHLRKLNNFNTMYAVLSGLQLSSVNRLKYTKEKVPKKLMQVFESLVELMSPTKSFKAYRDALVSTIPPCIPYLGLCLTDLTFIEEGNPDFIAPPEENKGLKLINFKKREKLFRVIYEIQQYQGWKYQALQGYTDSTLEELPRNEEEQLYGMSLLREPRNASREQIV